MTHIDFSTRDNCHKDKTHMRTHTHTYVYTELVTGDHSIEKLPVVLQHSVLISPTFWWEIEESEPHCSSGKNMLATVTRTSTTTADLNLFYKGKGNTLRWFAMRFPSILLPNISGVKLHLWADILCLHCQIASNLIWCGGITLIICNYHSNSRSLIAALIGQKPNIWRSLR